MFWYNKSIPIVITDRKNRWPYYNQDGLTKNCQNKSPTCDKIMFPMLDQVIQKCQKISYPIRIEIATLKTVMRTMISIFTHNAIRDSNLN